MTNSATGTGIDDDLTDMVGRLQFRPIGGVDLSYRYRFDVVGCDIPATRGPRQLWQ